MARIVVQAMPYAGHNGPVRAVTEQLVARGHDVRAYVGAKFAASYARFGARPVPWVHARDFDDNAIAETFPRFVGASGRREFLLTISDIFVGTAAGQARDLLDLYEREPWDLLFSETLCFGPPIAAEVTGRPWASLSVVPLLLPSAALPPSGLGIRPGRGPLGHARDAALRVAARTAPDPTGPTLRRQRRAFGLAGRSQRVDTLGHSRQLTLVSGVSGLDFERPDLPGYAHYVGALGQASTGPFPAWWGDVTGSRMPVVHVTQGTQNLDPNALIRPALDALADREVLVVASTGIAGRDEFPFPVPANVRVAGFVPHAALLPLTSVMITNGGFGGVLAGLSNGVPLIVAGGDLDKPEVARRVEFSGAGIDLRTGRPSAASVARALDRIDREPAFRARAAVIARQFEDRGGAIEAADLIERQIV